MSAGEVIDPEGGDEWQGGRYTPPKAPDITRTIAEKVSELGRMLSPAERLALLDEGEVMDAVRSGVGQRDLAKGAGVTITAMREWLNADGRSARYMRARSDAAQAYDEMAEGVILSAPSSPMEIARARELASHYRWRAKVVDPNRYGDKVQATVVHDVVAELRDRIHAADSRLPIVERNPENTAVVIGNDIRHGAKPLIHKALPGAALTGPHSDGGSDDAA